MNNNETIEDKEILYRRVKVHKPNIHFNDRRYERHKSGKIEVLPLAFYDRSREISVDRASKHNFDPSKTQRDKTDGIAKLITGKVPDIDIEDYKIDVKYDPDDMNDAHSIIVMVCAVVFNERSGHGGLTFSLALILYMSQNMYFTQKLAYIIIGCLFACTMFIGCGADTDSDVAEIVRINEPNYADINRSTWQAEIQVRFSQSPQFLEVAEQQYLSWEQTKDVVILSFNFPKVKLWGTRSSAEHYRLREEVPAEKQLINTLLTHHINTTLTWSTGRKHIKMSLKPPRVIAEDLSPLPRPQAALGLVSPAGKKLPANQTITLYFDNNPGKVTTSVGTVTGSGETRTITPPVGGFPLGSLSLTITWENCSYTESRPWACIGRKTLNYTVVDQ